MCLRYYLLCLVANLLPMVLKAAVQTIPQWDIFEEVVENENAYEDPFTEVELKVRYTRPDGTQVDFPGFYAGDDMWKFRMMADQPGLWKYRARFSDNTHEVEGTFRCVDSDLPGMISRDESNPIWFGYRGGDHELIRSLHVGDCFFASEDNQITGEPWSVDRRNAFLDWAQAQGYNMLSIGSHYLNRVQETRGIGWNTPDLWDASKQRPNPEAYNRMEAVLDDLAERRFLVFPFAGFFGKHSNYPQEKAARELYIQYTLSRIGAYWNLLFNVAGPEPLVRPSLHMPQEEVNMLGKLIASRDVFGHLLSVHNKTGDDPFIEEPWAGYGVLQGPKTVDRAELSDVLLRNHHPERPLYAQETLWPGNIWGHPPYSHDDIRKNAFVVNMSAAALNFADMDGNSSSGFSGKIDMSMMYQERHDIVKRVWDFFETIPFYRLSPAQELVDSGYCLADPGQMYLVYMEIGGAVTVELEIGSYRVTWIDARNTSDRREHGIISETQSLRTPREGDDWLLLLERIP